MATDILKDQKKKWAPKNLAIHWGIEKYNYLKKNCYKINRLNSKPHEAKWFHVILKCKLPDTGACLQTFVVFDKQFNIDTIHCKLNIIIVWVCVSTNIMWFP